MSQTNTRTSTRTSTQTSTQTKEQTKTCKKCRKTLPISSFYSRTVTYTRKDGSIYVWHGHSHICKTCESIERKDYKYKKFRDKEERIDRLDRAMSTDEGFDKLLKEYGL